MSIYNWCCFRRKKPKFPETGFYNSDVLESFGGDLMNESNIPPTCSTWTQFNEL